MFKYLFLFCSCECMFKREYVCSCMHMEVRKRHRHPGAGVTGDFEWPDMICKIQMNNFHQKYRKWKIEIYHIYCTLILNHDLKEKKQIQCRKNKSILQIEYR